MNDELDTPEIAETIEWLRNWTKQMFQDIQDGKINNNPEIIISGTVKLIPAIETPMVVDVYTTTEELNNDIGVISVMRNNRPYIPTMIIDSLPVSDSHITTVAIDDMTEQLKAQGWNEL